MKLLRQEKPQCLVYSLAMLLDIEPYEIHQSIGHDGMELTWPDLPAPYCYKGVCIQELVDFSLARGIVLLQIDSYPAMQPLIGGAIHTVWDHKRCEERLHAYMSGFEGIIMTSNHACAWDRKDVYDPRGILGNVNDYSIRVFVAKIDW